LIVIFICLKYFNLIYYTLNPSLLLGCEFLFIDCCICQKNMAFLIKPSFKSFFPKRHEIEQTKHCGI
jgi:hypothetical protein